MAALVEEVNALSIGGEEKEEYDPTARSCGWCYVVLLLPGASDAVKNDPSEHALTIRCPHCPRLYCGPSCYHSDQVTHDFWCGKAGEKGVDFDVCHVAGKGLGVITKRAFERGEKILAERPIMTTTNLAKIPRTNHTQSKEEKEKTDESIREAAMALTPLDGDLQAKLDANCVSLGERDVPLDCPPSPQHDAGGLFLTFSRVNHDCLGNADHYFDHQHGVELLVANDRIPAFTEVTFPYARTGKDRLTDLNWRGFACTCTACQTPILDLKVNQMSAFDKQVVYLGCQGRMAEAVELAHNLLHLYDEVNASCRDYARVHFDLFQILVASQDSLDQAHHHMVQAYQYALSFCGYEGHETVQRYKGYVEHPEIHGNYRAID